MAYNWLLFDLDGTLLDFHKAEYLCMKATLQSFGFRMDDEVLLAYRSINESYWKMLERGEISQEELALARHRTLFERFGFTGDVEAFQNHYEGALSESSYLYDGAYELLRQLRDRDGIHLAIVTNGFARIQERRIALAGLDTLFERIFISEQVGYRKPQVEFFEHVFREIGEGNAMIIGDSLTSDIKGGADFGIATCWFNPDGQDNPLGVRVDYEIRDLNEIWQLV
ncbi:MAG: YjjG family noncanonical pyrimidine nucleotidase [Eubacteriales bacterium]|nr:YjjG family noncanonical pyrimidine nucleotidase [Eubacteriales bacterium]